MPAPILLYFHKSYVKAHTKRFKDGRVVQVAAHYDKRTRKGSEHAPEHEHDTAHLAPEQRARFAQMHAEQHLLHHYHGHALRARIATLEADHAAHTAAAEAHRQAGRHVDATKSANKAIKVHARLRTHRKELADVDARVSGIGAMKDAMVPGSGSVAPSTDETHARYAGLGARWKGKAATAAAKHAAETAGKKDNQGRNLEAVKQNFDRQREEYEKGKQASHDFHERTIKNVPHPDWTEKDGIPVLRSGNSKYIAAPRNGKKTAANFDIIDTEKNEHIAILGRDEVRSWLWASAKTEFEEKNGYPPHEEGPRDGDTKQGADGLLTFRGGRWHGEESFDGKPINRDAGEIKAGNVSAESGTTRTMGSRLHAESDSSGQSSAKRQGAPTVGGGNAGITDIDDPNSPNYRYRDTGYVAGSRKELAAEMLKIAKRDGTQVRANTVDWESIEANPRQAKTLITKSHLFGSVDWEGLKEGGMEPGTGFLVDRIYASVGKEPVTDSAQARQDYAIGLESLRDRLEVCKAPDDVAKLLKEIKAEYDGVILNEDESKRYAELSEQIATLQKPLRAAKDESDRLYQVYNTIHNEAATLEYKKKRTTQDDKKWAELKQQSASAFQSLRDYRDKNAFYFESKKRDLENGWSASDSDAEFEIRQLREARNAVEEKSKQRNAIDNPVHRAWHQLGERFHGVINYRGHKGSDSFGNHMAAAKAGKVADWSWAEKESVAGPRSSKESERFQLFVADTYDRNGGRTIKAESTDALKAKFGLREVQSGNWVLRDVNSAKFHVERTAEAFADLADLVGVTDDKIAMNGRMALAFGARGKGGARAHYEPVERIINLTKMSGGGSLAHEWFHALDNLIGESFGQTSKASDFITESPNLLPAGPVRDAFSNLHVAMHEGSTRATKTIPITDSDRALARHNIKPTSRDLQGRIRDAGSLNEAIAAVDAYETSLSDRNGVVKPKTRKHVDRWRTIAAAYWTPEGDIATINVGPAMSNFAAEAGKLDNGKLGKYWSQPKEMAARAFSAWCEDRLSDAGRKNDYLSNHSNNRRYLGGEKPFPEGEERTRINAAFDQLVEAMRKHNTLEKSLRMLRGDSPMILFFKAHIHGHYRLNQKTGARVWVDSYDDKRAERKRTEFAHWQHRVEHFNHHLAHGRRREALHAFHDLGHEDSHKLANHLGLAGDEKHADKKALMESIHGKIGEKEKSLKDKIAGQTRKDWEKRKGEGKVGKEKRVKAVPETVDENIRIGGRAIDRVISSHEDVKNAMYREEHGWVSFYWGKVGNPNKAFAGGSGIAKIIAKRISEGADGEAVARKMVDVIARGQAGPIYGPKGGERFDINYDGHTAVLSLRRFGERETWLLTGWHDVASDGGEAGNASATYASGPSGMQGKMGAEPNQRLNAGAGKGKSKRLPTDKKTAALKQAITHLEGDSHQKDIPADEKKEDAALVATLKEAAGAKATVEHVTAQQREAIAKRQSRYRAMMQIHAQKDDLLTAIAKAGGLSRKEAKEQGIDPAAFGRRGFGIHRVFTTGGMSFDGMAELLVSHGYPVVDEKGNYNPNDLLDSLDSALRGKRIISSHGADAEGERLAERHQDQWANLDDPFDGPAVNWNSLDAWQEQNLATPDLERATEVRNLGIQWIGEDAFEALSEKVAAQYESASNDDYLDALEEALIDAYNHGASKKPAGASQGTGNGFDLDSYSEADIAAREDAKQRKAKDEELKAKGDAAAREPFVLSGSSRPVDELEARGQGNLFDEGKEKSLEQKAEESFFSSIERLGWIKNGKGYSKTLKGAAYGPDSTLEGSSFGEITRGQKDVTVHLSILRQFATVELANGTKLVSSVLPVSRDHPAHLAEAIDAAIDKLRRDSYSHVMGSHGGKLAGLSDPDFVKRESQKIAKFIGEHVRDIANKTQDKNTQPIRKSLLLYIPAGAR